MTQDDIIRMAREAGLTVGTNISGVMLVGSPSTPGIAHISIDEMQGFAALVAAAEREACAKLRWASMIRLSSLHSGTVQYVSPQAIARVIEAGASSQGHGIRSIVKTFDGATLECSETAHEINAAIAKATGGAA
jgi:hypothetical protein